MEVSFLMKPYKILRPTQPLWKDKTLLVSVTKKNIIKLPLKLFMKCHPLPRDKHIADKIRIYNEQRTN
jgi:hypothetical protein